MIRLNQYDNPIFFAEYAKMPRSQYDLAGTGEWQQLEPRLENLIFRWHTRGLEGSLECALDMTTTTIMRKQRKSRESEWNQDFSKKSEIEPLTSWMPSDFE